MNNPSHNEEPLLKEGRSKPSRNSTDNKIIFLGKTRSTFSVSTNGYRLPSFYLLIIQIDDICLIDF